ncbi:CcdB family protein [Devosia ginsengisoli]|uniref:Toxin CcdB n=1 Tax=Devosia ginsengisoli TaxID=400770 RepID=A0A5B8LP03_9HYPH|nr:CcdB family protein [Devosia ginsengisoli]QDZ09669.1 plasmid maintenance protein CcdB [Devosia ginsengisoli]
MARYDVRSSADGYLYVEVQADILDQLNTRVVIPLMSLDVAPVPAGRLNPIIRVADVPLSLVTQYLAAVRASTLGPVVGSVAHEQDRISLALDMLLKGY